MTTGRTTFRSLFRECPRVEIPMIQRDYAQGRDDAHSREILTDFLDTLRDRIVTPDSEPLDLHFVYGRWREDRGVLEPLDGQQRLTTLFLLHWYLAQRDDALEAYQTWMQRDGKCCFSYRTRASAEEFLEHLVATAIDLEGLEGLEAEEIPLSTWLEDRPWFLRAWKRDPTVAGCLATLDAVDNTFHDVRGGYARLVEDEPVFFRLLKLGEFKLSDDLYVKMNARGKPLTRFEVFKAQLEQYVERTFGEEPCPHHPRKTWRAYVCDRMDREWTHFLWDHRDRDTHEIDGRFMLLLRAIAVLDCVMKAGDDAKDLDGQIEGLLDETVESFSFNSLEGLLDRGFVERMTSFLDLLAAAPERHLGFLDRSDYYDEAGTFTAILESEGQYGIPLPAWARFCAWGMFLLDRRHDVTDDTARTTFHEWMRVVCNLVDNSAMDKVDRLVAALRRIRAMSSLGVRDGFLERVAREPDIARGMNREQRVEEQLKASLILADSSWRPLLERAEAHAYFRGDIQFLLRFCGVWQRWSDAGSCEWSEMEHRDRRASFQRWYERACAVFPPDLRGLGAAARTDYLWERALLTKGDYLLRRGANMSLLDDLDRDGSWKRLLRADTKTDGREDRRDVVRDVLASVDSNNVVPSLRAVVDAGPPPDAPAWRRFLAGDPRLLEYCRRRMLRFHHGREVLLLKTTQLNGYYVDLFTWTLFLRFGDHQQRGGLATSVELSHPERIGWTDPSRLTMRCTNSDVFAEAFTHEMQLELRVGGSELPVDELRAADWSETEEGWARRVPPEQAEQALLEVAGLVGWTAEGSASADLPQDSG